MQLYDTMKNIAVFASGKGSNAKQIINYFRDSKEVRVKVIVSSNPRAGVVHIAAAEEIGLMIINKNKFEQDGYITAFTELQIDLIVLAGFLWKIPPALVMDYPDKIINLHPALLPKYGGKGMYGKAVHEAVLAAGDKKSGITIHYVDDQYDHGKIIFQASCEVGQGETAETLAEKVHRLEHKHYPKVIEKILAFEK